MGRKYATPVNRMGATSPAPRLTARMVPVRIPGTAWGRTTKITVWKRVAPSASEASRSSRGTARRASSVATITTGKVSTAMVRAAHSSAGWPHTRAPPENTLSMPAPTNCTKKPRPNRPNTIEGTPARLLTAMRTEPGQQRLGRGVLAQVDGGRHPDRHDRHRHQQHHRHRAKQRREDPALGHALLGRGEEERAATAGVRRG